MFLDGSETNDVNNHEINKGRGAHIREGTSTPDNKTKVSASRRRLPRLPPRSQVELECAARFRSHDAGHSKPGGVAHEPAPTAQVSSCRRCVWMWNSEEYVEVKVQQRKGLMGGALSHSPGTEMTRFRRVKAPPGSQSLALTERVGAGCGTALLFRAARGSEAAEHQRDTFFTFHAAYLSHAADKYSRPNATRVTAERERNRESERWSGFWFENMRVQ